jgi:hypothetical protein
MNPKITREDLELERKTIGDYDFNREYNAQFIDDQYAYFPTEIVQACTDDYELNPETAPVRKENTTLESTSENTQTTPP